MSSRELALKMKMLMWIGRQDCLINVFSMLLAILMMMHLSMKRPKIDSFVAMVQLLP